MLKHLCLIGAGQIGSRHLQALLNADFGMQIDVYDPSEESLKITKSRAEEVPYNHAAIAVSYATAFPKLPHREYDLAIMATTSDVRAELVQTLLMNHTVHALVLEKVLFQKEADFKTIENLLQKKKVKAWVNCPRRLFSFNQYLRELLHEENIIHLYISGGNWGLGCNAIHFVDYMSFLRKQDLITNVNISYLNPVLYETRRPRFKEFSGLLSIDWRSGSQLLMRDMKSSSAPVTINIVSDRFVIIIDETNGSAIVMCKNNNWKQEIKAYDLIYQSNLTHLVAGEIFATGTCRLTPYAESQALHIPVINAFNEHIYKVTGEHTDVCPIT